MTALAVAMDRRQWELVALYLLLGVARAADRLPPDTVAGLLAVLTEGTGRGGRR